MKWLNTYLFLYRYSSLNCFFVQVLCHECCGSFSRFVSNIDHFSRHCIEIRNSSIITTLIYIYTAHRCIHIYGVIVCTKFHNLNIYKSAMSKAFYSTRCLYPALVDKLIISFCIRKQKLPHNTFQLIILT